MRTLLIIFPLLTAPCVAQQPATKAQALAALSGAASQTLQWDPTMETYNGYKTLTENYLSDTVTWYQNTVKPITGELPDVEVMLDISEPGEGQENLENAQHKIKDPDPANVEDADSQIALATTAKGVGDAAFLEASTAFQEGRWDDCVTNSNGCTAAYGIAYGFIGEANFYLGEAKEIINIAETDCFQAMGY